MKTNVAIPNIRDNYWDTLKFVLIFLVVFGHVLEVNYPPGSVNRGIYNFIYSFHMPLFVFISGRFSHIKNRANYKKGIIRLLETYVAFQVIRTILTPPPPIRLQLSNKCTDNSKLCSLVFGCSRLLEADSAVCPPKNNGK